ncbi:replication-relaxation family protein [Streptomyces sp. NBC_00687]|uniref:replication-relaxation family protein n=1 Tax=Streptomyces sp. NBC_00687 TaxID=2975807 RepID=UPI00225577E8|nr:replication-relaxation family protein [Streptomyces sp. NBC_00687]MCX4920297.1 replication-relaxation family protein [Streptomyces sp. NBC_00687]
MGGSKAYPYGSTTAVRGHVLAALGVLKLATADQMHRLMAPGHRDNKAFRNAALDLARHGLVVSEGSSRDGHKIWHLTPVGLDAAAEVLGRPMGEMGGTARGAARSGAPHAMAVNETIIAITRTPAAATRPVPRPQITLALAAETTGPTPAPSADVPGIGWVGSWSTEVPLAAPSSRSGRAGVRADAVLTAPEAGVPVLFVEVDNCTEPPETLEAKFEKYLRYFRLTTKSSVGDDMPLWRTHYRPSSRDGHPPLVFVFNPGTRIGPQALKNRMTTVLKGTRQIWSGDYQAGRSYGSSQERDGYWDFTDAIPVLFTTLDRLQAGGPHAAVWWRCGHRQWETLPDALDNPTDHRAWQAREKVRRARHEDELAQRQRERERDAERERAEERERWATKPPEPEPAPEVAPCEWCGRPITGGPCRQDDAEFAPPEGGRHCPTCRSDIRSAYPTLRQALFGNRQRGR